jgi:hypothetical protein
VHARPLALLAALACAAPQASLAADDGRIVVRRPLGGETRGQFVLRDAALATDPNSPSLNLQESLSVEVMVNGDPNATVGWTTTPTATFGQVEGASHARVDRYASRINFAGPIEEDVDGDGVADGYIAATWPAQLGFAEIDGTPIGAPFDVALALTDEVPDTTYTQLFSPSQDPTRLDTLAAQVGLLGAGTSRAHLVARVSHDSLAEVAYVVVSFGTPEGGPDPIPPVMILPLKASTVRLGADTGVWSSLSALSPTNQGEVPVQWSLADGFGGLVTGADAMVVDTRDLLLQRITSVQEPGSAGRVTTRVAVVDPTDLEGGQHLLLSRTPLDDGTCPGGTVALQGRCYLDPGDVVETGAGCEIGYHLCSCGQCVRNRPNGSYMRKGGFILILEAPPAPTTFPAVLTAEVSRDDGAVLRVGTCFVESETSPCALDYGDGADTEDTLKAPEGWLSRANFATPYTPETDGDTVTLSLVPLDPNTAPVRYAQDREFTFTIDRVKLSGNTSDLGGEWTYEVELLDPTGSFPIATASTSGHTGPRIEVAALDFALGELD